MKQIKIDVNKYKTEYGYDFNGVKISDDINTMDDSCFEGMCLDSFGHVFGFTYDELQESDREGPYTRDGFDIEPGDVVIDAGAHVGDFSAYACYKGASKAYAFEPCPNTFKCLKKTAELNGPSFIPVNKGLSNKTGIAYLYMHKKLDGCNTMEFKRVCYELYSLVKRRDTYWFFYYEHICAILRRKKIRFITLDDFVKDNNIEKVDFIKADIEGAERLMLAGAKNVLKTMQPKLSICTYHYPDDPEVLPKIILEANPNYTIEMHKKKLFAYVKDR